MNELNAYGVGMSISRTINGKRVNLSSTKKSDQARIDMVVEMSARHARLLVEQDWKGLIELAQEYANLGALTTANQIMLETPASGRMLIVEQVNQYVIDNPEVLASAKPVMKVKK